LFDYCSHAEKAIFVTEKRDEERERGEKKEREREREKLCFYA